MEPVLGPVKAAAGEVALGDELVAAVLAARFDDVMLASLLLEEDAVVVPEMLTEVELEDDEMLLDENGALAIITKVENEDRLLLVIELEEEEVLAVELGIGDGEVLLEVEEAGTVVKPTNIAKLLELDNEDRASEPDGGGAVLMLEEVSVLEWVIRVTFEEDETVLVLASVPKPKKVPNARLEVTVGSTATELVAKETTDATTWLRIRAVVEREVVVGTVVARAEASSQVPNIVVLLG